MEETYQAKNMVRDSPEGKKAPVYLKIKSSNSVQFNFMLVTSNTHVAVEGVYLLLDLSFGVHGCA